MKTIYALIKLLCYVTAGMYSISLYSSEGSLVFVPPKGGWTTSSKATAKAPSSFQEIGELYKRTQLTYEQVRTFWNKHDLNPEKVSAFMHSLCVVSGWQTTAQELENACAGFWIMRECKLYMGRETKKHSTHQSQLNYEAAQLEHAMAQSLCLSDPFRQHIENAEDTEDVEKIRTGLHMLNLFSLFSVFRREDREEWNKEMDDYYREKKGKLEQRIAKLCIGEKIITEFRKGTLTLKKSKRIFDETYPVTTDTPVSIVTLESSDATLFGDIHRQAILDAGRALLKQPEKTSFDQLENCFAAIWFLLKCERSRTLFGDDQVRAVEDLAYELSTAPEHQKLLLDLVGKGILDKNNAIRAARIGSYFHQIQALYLTNPNAGRYNACEVAYNRLIGGTRELDLSFYRDDYSGIENCYPDDLLSDDGEELPEPQPIKSRSRLGFSFRRILPWGATVLGAALIAAASAFAYQKYGTKKPQPKAQT